MAQLYELLHPMPGAKKGQIFSIAKNSTWARPLGKKHGDIWIDADLVRTSRYWFKKYEKKDPQVVVIDKNHLAKLQELFFKLFPIKNENKINR